MNLQIARCDDEALWTRVGREANADRPEYAEERVVWPVYALPQNRGADLSLVAHVDGRPVGRLQRRGETLLEIAVAPDQRRRGIGAAMVELAVEDARRRALPAVRPHLYVDETDPPMLAFFDSLGFTRRPVFSMLADLAEPIPAETQERARRLQNAGFRTRLLDKTLAADVALIAAMHERYFPGFPGYMSITEMVRLFLDRGGMAMVLEKADECAGLLMGVIHGATRNGRLVRREGYGLLSTIATSKDFRRIGVASTVMCAFIDLLKAQGPPPIRYMLYGGCGPPGDPSRGVAESVGARREICHVMFAKDLAPSDAGE